MNMNVTRQVISDLWPIFVSEEASPETRDLIEKYLAADPEFAGLLRESASVDLGAISAPPLPPDHEMKTLARTKKRLWGFAWLLQLACLFSALAFGRIVSDTSWDVSPRNFIVMASIAAAFWIAFCVSLIRLRARIMIVTPGKPPPRE